MNASHQGIQLSIVTLPFDAERPRKVANQSLLPIMGRSGGENRCQASPRSQNANFSANCINRGAAALTTCPKVVPLMLPFTAAGP